MIVKLTGAVAANPLPVAVGVTVYVPALADELAVSVTVKVPLPGAGRLDGDSVAVTPAGSPATVSATAELNGPPTVAVSFNDVVDPIFRIAVGALAATASVGAGVINKGRLMLSVNAAFEAFSGTVPLPSTDPAAAVIVIVDDDPGVSVAGENCAVIPLGSAAVDSVKGVENAPEITGHVSFTVVVFPATTEIDAGLGVRLHAGAGPIVSVEVIWRENPVAALAPIVSG